MEEMEEKKDGPAAPEHYGRDTFDRRIEKLKDDKIGRPFNTFEATLSLAGTDVEQLKGWIQNPDMLPDEKVEDFMRSLSTIMMDFKVVLGEGKSLDPEGAKEIQKKLKDLIKEYFD